MHTCQQQARKWTHVLTGTSMVKWTTLDPCSSLSGSDPKLYANFEVYEIKNS